jgi:hypothetical protein
MGWSRRTVLAGMAGVEAMAGEASAKSTKPALSLAPVFRNAHFQAVPCRDCDVPGYLILLPLTPADRFNDLGAPALAVASQECTNRGVLPVGMEIFSGASQTQWDFIKSNIDFCDFMIVILSGRYGSLNTSPGADNTISFTHSEYRYAIEKKMPVVAMVREMTAGQILDANNDLDTSARMKAAEQMTAFRREVLGNGFMSRIWGRNPNNLNADFTTGVALTIERMKADCLATHAAEEIDALVTHSIKARSTSNDFDHADLIMKSKSAKILMNDGYRFFEKYRSQFASRLAAGLSTEICLLAPDGPHIKVVAQRSEKLLTEQQNNIRKSTHLLRAELSHPTLSALKIYHMRNFFPYCLFMYDDLIVISLYLAFEREEELPMFIFERTANPADIYFSLLKNTDRLFRRAEEGDPNWFDPI